MTARWGRGFWKLLISFERAKSALFEGDNIAHVAHWDDLLTILEGFKITWLPGTMDSFMWGSYQTSLQKTVVLLGCLLVPEIMHRWGTWGLPPPVKAGTSPHSLYSVGAM